MRVRRVLMISSAHLGRSRQMEARRVVVELGTCGAITRRSSAVAECPREPRWRICPRRPATRYSANAIERSSVDTPSNPPSRTREFQASVPIAIVRRPWARGGNAMHPARAPRGVEQEVSRFLG